MNTDDLVPLPAEGRTFADSRRIRLTDLDAGGRLRLDVVARFLQEIAIDDVDETGWGTPEHLWFVRKMRIDVLEPLVGNGSVELVTWCSGLAALAAGRRWSLSGDRGGRIEVDSVWIHLDADQRPARISGFDVYAESAGARRVSARPELAGPSDGAVLSSWPLRASDVDLHGHVNNTVYWQALEHVLAGGGPDMMRPVRARVEFREPLDLGVDVGLAVARGADRVEVGFLAAGRLKAVGVVERLVAPAGA